ncbi:membrane protein insertion efficiency factor YidD [Pseudoalteromonas viridis]|uniref:Membrane protein insertion efficiency factor YidD n=1 Tax=Pseudoalteromonas viridis TaxID=339617 RepID=A0ABX7VFZ3_9GAMM|nr:membrane protein insertion efficiency factor YidD [Pseudoalteromonas viridis]
MDYLAILLIRFYQRFISPYKGFRCAHAVVHGGESCSHAVLAIVKADGLWGGYRKIRARMRACKQAYLMLEQSAPKDRRENNESRCDCCDPSAGCDITSCGGRGKSCDASELSCDCWPF